MRDLPGPEGAPAVLLLHGLAASADLNWFRAYGSLAQRFRVVAIDHRGHGRGIRSRASFRLEDCADDAAAAAQLLGIERLIAVGYSMGGPIAKLLWRRHRRLVDGLVLCSTSCSFRSRTTLRIAALTLPAVATGMRIVPARAARGAAQAFLRLWGGDEGELQAWVGAERMRSEPRVVVEAASQVARFTSHDWICGIDVPTAVVVTSQDNLVPRRSQLELARDVGATSVHVIDADHLACRSRPDIFVPALTQACDFVAGRLQARPATGPPQGRAGRRP